MHDIVDTAVAAGTFKTLVAAVTADEDEDEGPALTAQSLLARQFYVSDAIKKIRSKTRYPQRALDKNLEGDCSVEYTVNPQGKVENPKVLDGCHPLFIRPSLAAANTFRYQPRIIDGQAVAVPAVRNTFHYRIK